jgi:hypothetical protein
MLAQYGIEFFSAFAIMFLGMRYIVLPLRLRASFRLAAKPDLQPVDPSQKLPEDVATFFDRAEESLRSCGFERVGDYALKNLTARNAGNARLFANRTSCVLATILANYRKDRIGAWQVNNMSSVFRTDFSDGSALINSNIAILNFRPRKPGVRSYRFVKIRNPATLFRVHEGITGQLFGDKAKEFPLDARFAGDYLRFAQCQAMEEPHHLVATGYCYHDEATDSLRLTLKGAFLSVWKGIWPVKQMRGRMRDRKAAAILRQLDLDKYGQPVRSHI